MPFPQLLVVALLAITASSRPVPPAHTATHRPRARADTASYDGRANEIHVRVPRLDEASLHVDGVLDEPQWSHAARLTGFSQFSPQDGAPAEDATEVLVWYSSTAIHFGIHAVEPHGTARATLADRDRIATDDNVQLLIGTFDDGRQATVFAVNPLGVQADGTIVEANQSRSSGVGGGTLARDATDLSADYVFESKGRLTADGYVVEVRIPFKSLKYQSAEVQRWRFNVVRQIQHSGHEDSWAPAHRAGLSFLAQSGSLDGLTGLERGLVVDANPEVTQRTVGAGSTTSGAGWTYAAGRPELGGNARWGITNNLTLNATANPDFSQIEADAGRLTFDPRQALFFAEKRPFFLDGIEQFATPHSLIYTRAILQPLVAAKLTGKAAGTSIGFLSAVDGAASSRTGDVHPLFTLLRLQRDLGGAARVGLAYTDREDGTQFNRVADLDGALLFGGIYSVQGQVARSATRTADGRQLDAPLWHAEVDRNGRHVAFSYSLDGVHEDFRAGSGFLGRGGLVTGTLDQRFMLQGAPGAIVEALTFNPAYLTNWRYQSFVHQGDAIEKKLHFSLNAQWRGGWSTGVGYFVESFGFDPGLYARYRVLGTAGDTLPFTGTARIPNSEAFFSVNTPGGNRLSATAFYLWGRDENFYEWASSNIIIASYGVTARPTDRLRLDATYNLQSYNRRSDGSIVGNNRIPRLKVEYQLARPVFVRLVGEYDSLYRDALRDEGRTGLPLLVDGQRTAPSTTSGFRGDFLFSYQPNPGTVFFAGYGARYDDMRSTAALFDFPRSFGFRGYNRIDDALFVKASYLFRL
jgi:hypothetical protein